MALVGLWNFSTGICMTNLCREDRVNAPGACSCRSQSWFMHRNSAWRCCCLAVLLLTLLLRPCALNLPCMLLVSSNGKEWAQLLLGKTSGGAPTISKGVALRFNSSVIMKKDCWAKHCCQRRIVKSVMLIQMMQSTVAEVYNALLWKVGCAVVILTQTPEGARCNIFTLSRIEVIEAKHCHCLLLQISKTHCCSAVVWSLTMGCGKMLSRLCWDCDVKFCHWQKTLSLSNKSWMDGGRLGHTKNVSTQNIFVWMEKGSVLSLLQVGLMLGLKDEWQV